MKNRDRAPLGAQGGLEAGTPLQNEPKSMKNRWKFERNPEKKIGERSALFFKVLRKIY